MASGLRARRARNFNVRGRRSTYCRGRERRRCATGRAAARDLDQGEAEGPPRTGTRPRARQRASHSEYKRSAREKSHAKRIRLFYHSDMKELELSFWPGEWCRFREQIVSVGSDVGSSDSHSLRLRREHATTGANSQEPTEHHRSLESARNTRHVRTRLTVSAKHHTMPGYPCLASRRCPSSRSIARSLGCCGQSQAGSRAVQATCCRGLQSC